MRVGKKFTAGLIGVALALIARAPAWAADPPLGGARISAVEGEALVQPGEGEGWRDAPLNMPLLPGDRLQTGATGRLEVLLWNGTAFRLSPGSSARLVAVPPPDAAGEPAAAEVDLEAGRASVATGEGDRSHPAIILDSAGTRVHIYPRSQVRAEAVAPDATQVVLREGEAWVDSLGTSIPLRPGETLQVGPSGASRVANLAPDAFERWSDGRNRGLAAAPPASPYVPVPLAPSTAELNRYGEWTSVPEYGYVWRPTAVAAGWSPFTAGQWLWRAGTWVWVPAESWGYVPFHYGRWRWDPFHGWYWVPPRPRLVVWDPGPVAWVVTPTYVTWIPLAPGEVSYSPWPHRVWSAPAPPTTIMNVTNITVIKKTFVNAAAPAPVVAVPATTFTTTTVVTPTAPTATRVSLASLVANQPATVVTAAALAPAVADTRPAAPHSARATSPLAGPNPAPQARAPVPGATAPAPQAPGRAQAFAAPQATAKEAPRPSQSPAQSPNAGRAGGWGREAGRTPETSPAQPREPERPKAERPPTGFAAPPAAAPRAVPEPARPAPLERSYPRAETLRPQVRTDRERPPAQRQEFRRAPHAVEPVRPATPTPVPQAPFQARPSPRHETSPAAAPPQRQDRPHHVAHAPSPPPPAKPQPHPVLTR